MSVDVAQIQDTIKKLEMRCAICGFTKFIIHDRYLKLVDSSNGKSIDSVISVKCELCNHIALFG